MAETEFMRRPRRTFRPLRELSFYCAVVAAGLGWLVQLQAQVSPAAPPPADKTYTLSGEVVNSVTGGPLARALVQVVSGSAQAALTDSQGQFRIEGVAAGIVAVMAQKPGFFSPQQVSSEAYPSPAVRVGPDMDPLVLKLIPEGIIAGCVTDTYHEPIENAMVQVKLPRVVNGRKQWEQRAAGTTNEDGEFRVANLPPGAYYVEVDPGYGRKNWPEGSEPEARGFRATYYPGTTDLASATALQVQPGQKTEANFSLTAEPLFRVSGTVEGLPNGHGGMLQLMAPDGEYVPLPVWMRPGGGFEARAVPAGSYVLRASLQDANGSWLAGQLPITVGADLTGVHLRLQPTASLSVHVREESAAASTAENPVAPAAPGSKRAGVSVHLVSRDMPFLQFFATPEGKPEDPELVLRDVPAARYAIEVRANPPWYVHAVTSGGKDLLQEDLIVGPGSSAQSLEVLLRDDSGSIAGTVQSGADAERGTVLLVPANSASQPAVQPVSLGSLFQPSPAGSVQFRFPGLAPGEYDLLAFDQVEGLEYANPEALQEYTGRAVHVSLHPGETKSVNLELIVRGNQ